MLNTAGSMPRLTAWSSISVRFTWLYSLTNAPPRRLVGPPVLRHRPVARAGVGRAVRNHLGALGATLEVPHRVLRDPHRVERSELDDLIVGLQARAAVDHDVE